MTPQKFIKEYTKYCSNELTFGGHAPWLSPENALMAVDLAREELIKKAQKWLKEHGSEYIAIKDGQLYLLGSFSKDLKKHLEE